MDHRRPVLPSRAVAAVVAAAGLLVVIVVARSTPSHPIRNAAPRTTTVAPTTPPTAPSQRTRTRPPSHDGSHTLDTVLSIIVLLLLLVALWYLPRLLRLRGRGLHVYRGVTTPRPTGWTVEPEDETPVRAAVDAGFAALRSTDSDREAIIACWNQVVAALDRSGQASAPSETSTQIAANALTRQGLQPEPMLELGALFREARFSHHDVGAAQREAAQRCLERVETELAAVPREP